MSRRTRDKPLSSAFSLKAPHDNPQNEARSPNAPRDNPQNNASLSWKPNCDDETAIDGGASRSLHY